MRSEGLDIGRLVAHTLQREQAAAHARIAEASGCPVLADYLVFGRDHAELGADVLARWHEVLPQFVKVMPTDYKRVLQEKRAAEIRPAAAVA